MVAEALAAAADAERAADEARDSQLDFCKQQSIGAERTMKARQLGVAMSAVMEAAAKVGPSYMRFVRDAYATPQFRVPDAQEQVIREFRDDTYRRCLDEQGI